MIGDPRLDCEPPTYGTVFAWEVKCVLNNKNWPGAVNAIWAEVATPRRGKLTSFVPAERLFGIVVEIFKSYRDGYGTRYPQCGPDRSTWRADVERTLTKPWGGTLLEIIHSTPDLSIDHEWLAGDQNSVRLHLVRAVMPIA